jgi:hypothetical protein
MFFRTCVNWCYKKTIKIGYNVKKVFLDMQFFFKHLKIYNKFYQ